MPSEDRTTPEATEQAFRTLWKCSCLFGRKLDAMHQFHANHGIQVQRGRSRREDGRDYIRWCFADPGVAAEFADEFGGTIGEQHAN